PSPATTSATQSPTYTAKFLTETYLAKPGAIEGERKPLTVMFADVANSTRLFEKLDPEEVHWIMDQCFKLLMEEIHRWEGTINQFMGDGVMALFGAPVAHEDHAQRACHAALGIQKAMAAYEEDVRRNYGVDFKIRIGLNSGPVIVGAIGDDLRKDYTAVSSTVNLANRFENLAMPGSIVVSKDTYRLVKNYFHFEALGRVAVKGVEAPQEIFELVKAGPVATDIEASAKKGLTSFVGRTYSLAELMEIFARVKDGAGQVVGVVGEAGVGKSRLLHEFRNRLPLGESGYLEGRCVHFGSAMPYLPILDILKSYFEIGEGEREIAIQKRVQQQIMLLHGKTQELLSPLLDLLSLPVEDEAYLKLESRQRRERIFEALRDLLVTVSHEKPLIIAIEDLHWIDKASEEFIDYFIGWLTNVKVMLILLHRPEYTHPWASRSYFSRIGVNQLTRKSSTALIDAILEGAQVAPEIYDVIIQRSAGNPLFVEELTHALIENGIIQQQDHRYILSRKDIGLHIPDTIHGIIAARIDRLEEKVKRIIQLASVIGREFTFRVLQAVSEMQTDIKSHLLNLQGLELIYEKNLFPELEFVFKHALTVEVTYNSLLSNRKKEIHRSIGAAIETLYADNLEEYYEMLAYHYTKGEVIDKASRYLKYAGKKAARNHAMWEAFGFYKQAADLLKKLPDSVAKKTELIEVIQLMRVPMTLLGFPEDALPFLQLGTALAKELGDTRGLASFYALMGTHQSHIGDHIKAIGYTEEGLEEARRTRDIELLAPLSVTVCTSYSATSQYHKIVAAMPEIIARIEESGRQTDFFSITLNPYSYIGGALGAAHGHLGNFVNGEACLVKALDNALKINHQATLGATRFNFGWLLYTKGSYAQAKQHLEACIPCFMESQWPLGVALASCLLGHLNLFLGNRDTSLELAQEGLQIYLKTGIELYLSWCRWMIGGIYLELEDLPNAAGSMEEALRLSRKNSEQGVEGLALVGLGRVLGKSRPPQANKAKSLIATGLMTLSKLGMKPWMAKGYMYLGEFNLISDDQKTAKENLNKAAALFQDMGMDYWLNRTRSLPGA
ncbi:MAG: AAA family ATPase, partial [Desulfobacteraceae bacterium]|nr:AAA family ATPase [Desulfobacteraceae bacterium]